MEIIELGEDFTEGEADANQKMNGVLWNGYTLDGDADPNAAGAGSYGALLSNAVGTGTVAETLNFAENQAGNPFEAAVETALSGDGSLKVVVKGDNANETAGVRNLFFIDSRDNGTPPALNIEFNGVSVDTLTADLVGNLDMDAASILEVDVYNDLFTDLLNISGTADLDGTLDVNLITGSPLAINDTVTVLSAAGGITDSGLSVAGPFTHSIIGSDLVLTFTGAGTAGDADGDGDVDGADFLLLQRTNAAGIPAWETNYGAGTVLASGSAVPEPTSLVLLSLACLGGMLRRKK